jgi:hypothetical protein
VSKIKSYLDNTLRSILLPFSAFFLAVISGGLLIAFSDPKIYKLWKSPLELLKPNF